MLAGCSRPPEWLDQASPAAAANATAAPAPSALLALDARCRASSIRERRADRGAEAPVVNASPIEVTGDAQTAATTRPRLNHDARPSVALDEIGSEMVSPARSWRIGSPERRCLSAVKTSGYSGSAASAAGRRASSTRTSSGLIALMGLYVGSGVAFDEGHRPGVARSGAAPHLRAVVQGRCKVRGGERGHRHRPARIGAHARHHGRDRAAAVAAPSGNTPPGTRNYLSRNLARVRWRPRSRGPRIPPGEQPTRKRRRPHTTRAVIRERNRPRPVNVRHRW